MKKEKNLEWGREGEDGDAEEDSTASTAIFQF